LPLKLETVFGMGHPLSKHKTTSSAGILGGA